MSVYLSNNIINNNNFEEKPSAWAFLNKISVLQEIKSINKNDKLVNPGVNISEKLVKTFSANTDEFLSNKSVSYIDYAMQLEEIMRSENQFLDSCPVYHGNKNSIISDIYGKIAQILKINPEFVPIPRLNGKIFDGRSADEFLEEYKPHKKMVGGQEFVVKKMMHDHNLREELLCLSPTLISDFEETENAFLFFMKGLSIENGEVNQKITKTFVDLQLRNNQVDKDTLRFFQNKFPQNGYLHQIFFHDRQILEQASYPSKRYGLPLEGENESDLCTSSEFLQVLYSQDQSEKENFENKYKLSIADVQLRLLADPKLFLDDDKITIKTFRRNVNWNENDYLQAIGWIVRPVFVKALSTAPQGESFCSSPIAKILGGNDIAPFVRLVDYVFSDADHLNNG